MGSSPVTVLVIIGLYVGFFSIYSSTAEADVNDYGLAQDPGISPPEDGLFSAIGDVFSTIGGVFSMLIGALTFNVDGAPFWIRIPIAVAIIGSLVWCLVELIRGN